MSFLRTDSTTRLFSHPSLLRSRNLADNWSFTVLRITYFHLQQEQFTFNCTAIPQRFLIVPAMVEAFTVSGTNLSIPRDRNSRPVFISHRTITGAILWSPSNLCCQDFATALETNDNRSATNSSNMITIRVGGLVTKLYNTATYFLSDLLLIRAHSSVIFYSYTVLWLNLNHVECVSFTLLFRKLGKHFALCSEIKTFWGRWWDNYMMMMDQDV